MISQKDHDIKAVFFDIDGTLLSHKTRKVPDSTIEALNQLRERNVKTYICTGRNKAEISELPLDGIDFDGYLTMNGQVCYDGKWNIVISNPISQEDMEVFAQTFRAHTIPFTFVGEDWSYNNFVNSGVVEVQKKTMGSIPDIGMFTGEPIYQICAFPDARQKKILKDVLDTCNVLSWNEFGVDIFPKNGGKDKAIEKIIGLIGIERDNTSSFGDGENDCAMLRYTKLGIAMGNACPQAKAAACYITTEVDDDGVYNALKHFRII